MKPNGIYLIILILVLSNTLLTDMLITDDLYFRSFTGHMSSEMIMKALNIKHRFGWLSYVIAPLIVTIKMFLITGVLFSGSLFLDKS